MKSIKQIMEEGGYVEINEQEYDLSYDFERTYFCIAREFVYFKKKPELKFPKYFEDNNRKIHVWNNFIAFEDKDSKYVVNFDGKEQILLLIKSIKHLEENQK